MTTASAISDHLGNFTEGGIGGILRVGTRGHGDPVKSDGAFKSINSQERGHHKTFADLESETHLDINMKELQRKAKIDPRETLKSYGKWAKYKSKEPVFRILRYEFKYRGHELKSIVIGKNFIVMTKNNKKIRNPFSLAQK